MKCSNCKQDIQIWQLIEAVQKFNNGSSHIRGECPKCRSFVQWVPYSDSKTVVNVIKLFVNGDLDALNELRKTAILFDTEKEII